MTGKPKRQQNQKTIRMVLAKINRKMAEQGITKDEWFRLAEWAVTCIKALGRSANASKPQPTRSPDGLF